MIFRCITVIFALLACLLMTPSFARAQTFSAVTSTGDAVTCGQNGEEFTPGAFSSKGKFIAATLQIQTLQKRIKKLRGSRRSKDIAQLKKASLALREWRKILKNGASICSAGPVKPTPTQDVEKETPTPSPTPENTVTPSPTPTGTATSTSTPTSTPTATPTFTPTPTIDPLRPRTTALTTRDVYYLYEKAGLGSPPPQAFQVAASGKVNDLVNFVMKYDNSELPILDDCAKYLDNDYAADLMPSVTRSGLQKWALCLLIKSKNPFHDRFAFLFLHNLLAVSASGLQESQLPLMREQLELMRAFAVKGSYRDLVKLHTRQGATLQYLNLAFSTAAQPNEDWARELMQLYTLGEYNPLRKSAGESARNYDENDVALLALAVTGHGLQAIGSNPVIWSPVIRTINVSSAPVTLFSGTSCEKRFTRDTFRAEPRDLEIIDHIFNCKAVEDFLAHRILHEYLNEDLAGVIDEGVFVRAFAKKIRDSGFNLQEAMRVLLSSQVFWQVKNKNSIVTTPVELVVSTIRRTEMEITPAHLETIRVRLTQAAHTITTLPSVFGYDNLDFADAARQVQVTNLVRSILAHSSFSGTAPVWTCNKLLPRTDISVKAPELVEHLNTRLNAELTTTGKAELVKFLDVAVTTDAQGKPVTSSSPYDSKNLTHETRLCGAIELLAIKNYTR